MPYTMVAMTRGDAHKIAEWVVYHARIGFDDFQLVLDGDVDGTESVLRALDVPAKLTLHPRREVGEYYDSLEPDERRRRVLEWRREHASELVSGAMRGTDAISWRQAQHLPEVMAPYAVGRRGRGWLAVIDVDEFLVLKEHRSVQELTAGDEIAPRLRFLNFNVDTTDYDPARPVLEQHSIRWSREHLLAHSDDRWAKRVKSLVRYRVARLNSIHKISYGKHTVLDPDIARLHHFRMPLHELDIPYTVDDPIRIPVDLSLSRGAEGAAVSILERGRLPS